MNVADVLTYGHEMVLRATDGLAEPDWLTPGVCGAWTVKDVVAHLASVELLIADVVGTFVGSGPTPHLDAFNRKDPQYNDEEVARRREWSVARTLGEYTEAAQRVLEVGSPAGECPRAGHHALVWEGVRARRLPRLHLVRAQGRALCPDCRPPRSPEGAGRGSPVMDGPERPATRPEGRTSGPRRRSPRAAVRGPAVCR
jgi:Mycothiol maleylpyruvate isomerase N-terminal domain